MSVRHCTNTTCDQFGRFRVPFLKRFIAWTEPFRHRFGPILGFVCRGVLPWFQADSRGHSVLIGICRGGASNERLKHLLCVINRMGNFVDQNGIAPPSLKVPYAGAAAAV